VLFQICTRKMNSKRSNQMFSIDDAFEEEHTDAIRVYGATTTTERSPLKPRNGQMSLGGSSVSGVDAVSVHIHDPPNSMSVKPIIRGLTKLKGTDDVRNNLKYLCYRYFNM
jgi:hypothetical protein